jgi:hypothetical protein
MDGRSILARRKKISSNMRRFWAYWGFHSFGISSPTLDVRLSGNGSTIFIF